MKLKSIFLSGREASYVRNEILIKALRRNFDVIVPNITVNSIFLRSSVALFRMLFDNSHYDFYFVGFYGQIIGLGMTCLKYHPVILDAYVSTYETLCEERKIFRQHSLLGRIAYWLDKESFRRADLLITDTIANRIYFANVFNLPETKIEVVYIGCDEELFYPRDGTPNSSVNSSVIVFYYGSFLPLHGIDVIIEAANLLKCEEKIKFIVGGGGPGYKHFVKQVMEKELYNVEIVGWIPYQKIPEYISMSTICLGGHFSNFPKAKRVISTKTYQFIAMRKPTIVGDSEAIRELFTPGRHVYAVQMGSGEALAVAIRNLIHDKTARNYIAENGYHLFRSRLTIDSISQRLQSILSTKI